MTLAEFIKMYRAEHDLSIRAFASMVDISPQQIINIEKGIGNDGKPMTSTMKTYSKIAKGIGMEERDFLYMLNDNVLVNPSHDWILQREETIVLSELSKKKQRLIKGILKLSDREVDALIPITEEFLSDV